MLKRHNGTSFVDPGSIKRWTGAAWEGVQTVKKWTGSAWEVVWNAMTTGITGYFNPVSAGLQQYRDDGTFYTYRLPSTAPPITAWQWDYVDYGGALMQSGNTTSSSLRLIGPNYNTNNFPQQYQVDIWCDITIGGVVYRTPTSSFYYQAGFM